MRASPKTISVIRGLTFIELFIVIIIVGILISLAIPRFRNTFNAAQLNSFSRAFQGFMNYLRERAVIEEKVIHLSIDSMNRAYWARFEGQESRLKTYPIPAGLQVEILTSPENNEVLFYPDGSIDEATIKISNPAGENITLTTEGVFGKVKIKAQE
jgi:Tfp pilus assembly protein FimT